jgi:transposase-like protein
MVHSALTAGIAIRTRSPRARARYTVPAYCAECNGQFTVTVGTVMERSKILLSKWLLTMHLMGASKNGMSALQLQRMLGVTYKSAWFLCHMELVDVYNGTFHHVIFNTPGVYSIVA